MSTSASSNTGGVIQRVTSQQMADVEEGRDRKGVHDSSQGAKAGSNRMEDVPQGFASGVQMNNRAHPPSPISSIPEETTTFGAVDDTVGVSEPHQLNQSPDTRLGEAHSTSGGSLSVPSPDPPHEGSTGVSTGRNTPDLKVLQVKQLHRTIDWRDGLLSPLLSLLLLVVFTALAWTFHFLKIEEQWATRATFAFCFLALIPLEILLNVSAKHLTSYLSEGLGELVEITLENSIEVVLAIFLLIKCELRLLQSTIVGVVTLHLLLVPGTAFLVGGIVMPEQQLEKASSDLNHSLLTMGGICPMIMIRMYAILIPTAYFVALGDSMALNSEAGIKVSADNLLSDATRDKLVVISASLSAFLILVYIASRLYILRPSNHSASDVLWAWNRIPSDSQFAAFEANNTLDSLTASTVTVNKASSHPYGSPSVIGEAPATDSTVTVAGGSHLQSVSGASSSSSTIQVHSRYRHGDHHLPAKGSQWWATVIVLLVTMTVMAITSEFLVESIDHIRTPGPKGIPEEFFGLILLPLASFSAGGISAILDFVQSLYRLFYDRNYKRPSKLVKARPIDISIQFVLFLMPFLVLLGAALNKPITLMFDRFELILLLSAAYLVNNVTIHAMTNWVKGLIMICLYVMIAIVVWFYGGSPAQNALLNCPGSVAEALQNGGASSIFDLNVIP
ncbi:hypothetical protein NM688_g568 [Phlebia brevispora]|uniref:Uncharacterized protein n=1 Tax=Phlebia brevispora TaxID=194682 RepID=A0ACC1TDN0_9APHY|nr:hypothetical protein NM688_g568 [Phlebia brevispora]